MKECLIIGNPVTKSLSPLMHNAGYKALKIDNDFLYSRREVMPGELQDVVDEIRITNVAGVSVTIPHKITIMSLLDEVDATAKEIGAVNTVIKVNGKLKGTNTDWLGILTPLQERCSLNGKKAVVFGAGGAARAACYALKKGGASVTVVNRTAENAKKLADDFKCESKSLESLSNLEDFDIILNSIPYDASGEFLPINPEYFTGKHIFFDMVYIPFKTPLIKKAEERGAVIIPGIEMLLYQGVEQFKIFTGKEAPILEMKNVLYEAVSK